MAASRKAPGPCFPSYGRQLAMERILQYADDLDDLVGAIGLIYEPLRRLLLRLIAGLIGAALAALGVLLALAHPPIALATCLLLFVTLLYREVTAPPRKRLRTG